MFILVISIVIGAAVLIALAYFLNKIPKKLHTIIIVVLLAAIGYFGYELYSSIAEPVKFEEVKEDRYKVVIGQLIKLRDAQNAHKIITGKYTDNIDKLARFVDTAQFALITKRDTAVADTEKNRAYGISDEGGYTKEITIIDTLGFKSVKDSLFKNTDVSKLLNYPFENAQGDIKLETGEFYDDEITISIFKATAKKEDILHDQNEKLLAQELRIKAVEAIDGEEIIVGSLDEVSTSGNWPRKYAPNDK